MSMVLEFQTSWHAQCRFNQRVKWRLPKSQREHLSDRTNLKKELSTICSKLEIPAEVSTKQRFEVLFPRIGKSPLILIMVINVNEGMIITLWYTGVLRPENEPQ